MSKGAEQRQTVAIFFCNSLYFVFRIMILTIISGYIEQWNKREFYFTEHNNIGEKLKHVNTRYLKWFGIAVTLGCIAQLNLIMSLQITSFMIRTLLSWYFISNSGLKIKWLNSYWCLNSSIRGHMIFQNNPQKDMNIIICCPIMLTHRKSVFCFML